MTGAPKPGRPSRRVHVPEVETQRCKSGSNHRLVNNLAATTLCAGCGASWAALDAGVRKP